MPLQKQTDLNKISVLLAEDDADDCLFFKKALEELPITTSLNTVKDGEELMQYLSENSNELPNVIFLDINMPRKTGPECLSEIMKNEKLKDIPVVMFSTTNDWNAISALFKSGAHVYIHKPSDFTQLKQVIHHALPIVSETMFPKNTLKYVFNA